MVGGGSGRVKIKRDSLSMDPQFTEAKVPAQQLEGALISKKKKTTHMYGIEHISKAILISTTTSNNLKHSQIQTTSTNPVEVPFLRSIFR